MLAGSTTLGLGGVASAAELHVEGPVRCVDRAELSFRVEHTLGRPLEEAVPLQVAVRAQRDAARWSARVDVSTADGPPLQRVVTASSCEELTDSLTVVIALALESGSAQAEASAPVGEAAPVADGADGAAGAEAAHRSRASALPHRKQPCPRRIGSRRTLILVKEVHMPQPTRPITHSALFLLACACSADPIDLAGGDAPGGGYGSGRCAGSGELTGSVLVTQQSELDELAGCEEIEAASRCRHLRAPACCRSRRCGR